MPKGTFYEGQTATNPSTGEKITYRGGKWQTADLAASAPVSSGSKEDRDALQGYRDASQKGLMSAQQAERFIELNEDTGTGGLRALPLAPWTKTTMGDVVKAGDPKWSEMKSISAAVGPNLRPPGSGSSSDTDVRLYMSAFPNVSNLGPANQGIAKRLQSESDQKAARTSFMDTWFAKRGNLLGAEQAFNDFWSKRSAGDPVANNVAPRVGGPPANIPRKPGGGYKILSVE